MKFLSLAILTCLLSQPLYADDTVKVFVSGAGDLHYEGPLTGEGVKKFKKLYASRPYRSDWVVMRSEGGEVDVGMAMGQFIFDHQLNVRVDGYCFSSCANYVFPAARTKILGKHAMLGYHGGAASESADLSDFDAYLLSVPASERKALRVKLLAEMHGYLQRMQKQEKEYYETIGVKQCITTIGQGEKYFDQNDSGEYVGWYYSIQDLKKLGVTQVSVDDPPWQPVGPTDKIKVYQVTVDSSLPCP